MFPEQLFVKCVFYEHSHPKTAEQLNSHAATRGMATQRFPNSCGKPMKITYVAEVTWADRPTRPKVLGHAVPLV
jgi:hypothetical protein